MFTGANEEGDGKQRDDRMEMLGENSRVEERGNFSGRTGASSIPGLPDRTGSRGSTLMKKTENFLPCPFSSVPPTFSSSFSVTFLFPAGTSSSA